jgi:hypothetical protein
MPCFFVAAIAWSIFAMIVADESKTESVPYGLIGDFGPDQRRRPE